MARVEVAAVGVRPGDDARSTTWQRAPRRRPPGPIGRPSASATAATTPSVAPTCRPPPRKTARAQRRTWDSDSSRPIANSSSATPSSDSASTSSAPSIQPEAVRADDEAGRDQPDERRARRTAVRESATIGMESPTSSSSSPSSPTSDTSRSYSAGEGRAQGRRAHAGEGAPRRRRRGCLAPHGQDGGSGQTPFVGKFSSEPAAGAPPSIPATRPSRRAACSGRRPSLPPVSDTRG